MQTTVLQRGGETAKDTPIPDALLRDFRQRYPQFRFQNHIHPIDSYGDDNRYFSFGLLRFKNRFYATCQVTFSTRAPHMAQFGTNTGTFVLTRSPLPFSHSQWRVREFQWQSYSMG